MSDDELTNGEWGLVLLVVVTLTVLLVVFGPKVVGRECTRVEDAPDRVCVLTTEGWVPR